MVFIFYDNSLLSDQDTNRFLVSMEIGLNPRSLIQLSETLPIELTETHYVVTCYLRDFALK